MALPFNIPSTLDPAFVFSRCYENDVEPMSVVYYDAFGTDPKNGYWWSPSKDNMMAWMQKRIRKKMDDRAVRHFKITDVTSGDLVGFARWDIPEGVAHFGDWVGAANFDANVTSLVNSEQEKAQRGADQELSTSAPVVESQAKYVGVDPPEGADPALATEFFNRLAATSEKWYTNDMLGLSLICTNPKYLRRGAAKAMIASMLDLADAQGIKAYLEATPAGKPIYEKLGFREVDSLEWDLGKLTNNLDGVYKLTIMIREPKPHRHLGVEHSTISHS